MPRPDRLPRWAPRAVYGSYELPPEEKLAWLKVEHFDQGPEGCWAGVEALAECLGMSIRTFERLQGALVTKGLLVVTRRGRKHASRYPVLPVPLPHRRHEASVDDVVLVVRRLDAHLRRHARAGSQSASMLADRTGGSNASIRQQVADRTPRPGTQSASIVADRTPPAGAALKKTAVGGGEGLSLLADVVSLRLKARGVAKNQQAEARLREDPHESEDEARAIEAAWRAMWERQRRPGREGEDA